MSKLKEQFLEVLKNESRITIQEEKYGETLVFIKGLNAGEDSVWCCFNEDDNEIRIHGEIGIKTNYKEIWIEYNECIVIKSIKLFKKYLKFALGLAAIYEQTEKQMKNLQRLNEIENDF